MEAEKVTETAKNVLQKFGGQQLLVGLIVAAAVSFAVAYVLYYLITRTTLNKVPYLFEETNSPKPGNELTKLHAGDIPPITNGRRMSFSFWMYIHDVEKYKGVVRHVMHIGEKPMDGAAPVVFLGPNDNKLYVAMTKATTFNYPSWARTQAQRLIYQAHTFGLVFDYIPIQRWVHVGIVINESVNGGSISGYLDGELVKTVTTGTNINTRQGIQTTNFQDLLLDKRGSLWIGGSMADPSGPGFSGLVSKVKFYNYDLNIQDMYNDYRSGPLGLGFLGRLGYGLRAPIYKTGAESSQ